MKKLVYIAGPFTASDPEEQERNVRAAVLEGERVRRLGHVPLVPHVAILRGLDWSSAMQECLTMLSRCDSVCLMPNWASSKGARMERGNAEAWGLEITSVLQLEEEAREDFEAARG